MKTHLVLVLVLVFGFCSCASDDDNSLPIEENSLIGRWKLVSITEEGEFEKASDCERKSIVEFKPDFTFKDIFVRESDDLKNCVYDGFGTAGSFILNDDQLVRTTTDIIAIPEGFDNPLWIEEAKGENEPETVSFENGKLHLIEINEEEGIIYKTQFTYEKTSDSFFKQ